MVLSMYSLETISTAFTATAGIMIVFGVAGLAFPRFFERVVGVCALGLFAVIAVELILMLLGVQQTATDLVVIVLFCGFIGYDVHRAATAVPHARPTPCGTPLSFTSTSSTCSCACCRSLAATTSNA